MESDLYKPSLIIYKLVFLKLISRGNNLISLGQHQTQICGYTLFVARSEKSTVEIQIIAGRCHSVV
jgi:hypothetical protein